MWERTSCCTGEDARLPCLSLLFPPGCWDSFLFPFLLSLLSLFLYLSGNNFHHYVPSAMQPTNKSSHMWICLNILCAKTPYTCESKPLIIMLQDILGEIPLTFIKWSCSTFFQKIQNSLNHEKRGFKIPSLAPSLSLNRETLFFSSSCNSPHHPDVINIWSYLQHLAQYVATQVWQAGTKHNEADINHTAQIVDQIYACTLTKSLTCHVILMWGLNSFCHTRPPLPQKGLTCLLTVY